MAGVAFPSPPPVLLKSRSSALNLPSSYLKSQKYPLLLLLLPPLRGRLDEVAEEIEEAYSSGDDDADIDDDDSDSDEESSIDLLFRFLQRMFRKVSKQAKKATRVVLPPVIPTQLVSFAVDGLLLLTALSVAKALLEVICNLGATVFAVIVLLRLVWAMLSHFQSGGNSFSGGGGTSTMPAA
ncbi:hypothetical protein ACLOJK_021038 [Asimina triloba]